MNTSFINQKKEEEHVYASWSKERNTWGNNVIINNKKYPPPPSSPPPPLPPPIIKRKAKPSIKEFVFKSGYIEVDY